MIALADTALEATFLPEAGMLGASLRHRGEELLGPRGIPLLHPWANRLSRRAYVAAGRRAHVPDVPYVQRDDHGLAIHGFAEPGCAWTVVEASATRLLVRLYHPVDGGRHAIFPFPHTLELEATVAHDALRVRTTIAPTSPAGVPVCFGFHPYLRLPGVPRRAWQVQLPRMRALELDLDQIPTGRSRPQAPWRDRLDRQTFDDAFVDVADGSEFVLEGAGRRIAVRFEHGFPVAQVFAPRHQDVVCFEPMTAPVDALVSGDRLRIVPEGDRFTAAFSIHVEDA
jgi:galactose mutarotase-like enzyme